MPSGIGSWRRRENSARLDASRLREERRATFTVADEMDTPGSRPSGHNCLITIYTDVHMPLARPKTATDVLP